MLSGPSGVGKDTVIRRLRQLDPTLRKPVAYTTRGRRPGECDGQDYSFVSEEEFDELGRGGEFLEAARVHGNLYGTSRRRVDELRDHGEDVLLKIDVQGAAQLRRRGGDACFIFLAPPSREVLLERLLKRETESAEELTTRTNDADRELSEAAWYDHVVVNDDVDRAVAEILALLKRELEAR